MCMYPCTFAWSSAVMTEDCLHSEAGLASTSLKLLYAEETWDEFDTTAT
jgi:hypothetical protein